jgi:hypothetical protein
MDEPRRGRLRFDDFQLQRFPNGRCRVTVRMEWTGGETFTGEAEGTQTLEGELRTAAEAALKAASGSIRGRLGLELKGVKAVKAFDGWVVVVLVQAGGEDDPMKLLGAFPCQDGDTPRGAVMAVMDATNRILERYLQDLS